MSSKAYFGGDRERDPLENVPTECYDVLRHPRRLRLLEVLGTHQTRLSLTELTTAIVENEQFDVSNGQARHQVRISLVHNHLPRLAEYDIVDWDTETGAELVDEPPIHPADLSALLELCDGEDGSELLETLVHPVRMRVLSVLANHAQPLSIEQLASELAEYDIASLPDAERGKISLYHSHLPMMAELGVLEFDHESGLVSRRDQPMLIIQ
ncbi:ArsR family transcriptional regulator [Natronorubrum sp. JWXQ-INN-674]|uniref:ArsR family transcriptional regulator n=1 Tax=Natronorubrum halalkaliphilum TaxID=2691917 RepID=A0A6B0VP64_9EURY|nr:ArsR family transcriptional regulator [Natronorubrum halalkaliphilum]MXV63611.1 ArsR family transcriptional regulator [Natronorubrum halalkaliphilum]